MKVSELLPAFSDYLKHERRLADQTQINYISDAKRFIRYTGDKPIEVIDQIAIRSWVRAMSHDNLSTSTIHRRVNAISTFFNWLRLEKHVSENPCSGIRLPRKNINQPDYLSEDDFRRFLFTESPYQLNYQIMGWLGLRVSEMLRLRWQDLRFREKIVIIRNTKGKEDRVLPLSDELITALQVFADKCENPKRGYLFQGIKPDTHLERYTFCRIFREYALSLGLNITSHWLRHSFATHLMRQGVDITVISKMLGHKRLSSSAPYLHHAQDVMRSAMDKNVLRSNKS